MFRSKLRLLTLVFIGFLLFSNHLKSQSYNFDIGLGTDPRNAVMIRNLDAGIGYSFTDNDYFALGFKLQYYLLIPRNMRDDYDLWSTTDKMNILTYAEGRYHIPLKRSNINTQQEQIFGFYPFARFYFDPYLPRRLKYISDNDSGIQLLEVKSDYGLQFGYGIGLGFYFEPKYRKNSLAITLEYNTLDGFEKLKEVVTLWPINEPGPSQFTLGISIFFW